MDYLLPSEICATVSFESTPALSIHRIGGRQISHEKATTTTSTLSESGCWLVPLLGGNKRELVGAAYRDLLPPTKYYPAAMTDDGIAGVIDGNG